ncbi:MAG: exonuclease domain-containing protein [Clostridia bacterium]|nr:exonuclease domain-containing protein [Clostridia bacterium]
MKIFIDLEMNPISKKYILERKICKDEIIEIGAVALNDQDEIVSEFKTYVNPEYNDHISRYIYKLTGISSEVVHKDNNFEVALNRFIKWCEDISSNEYYEIYAWSKHDIEQLKKEASLKQLDHLLNQNFLDKWVDYQIMFSEIFGFKKILSLGKAVEILDLDFQGNQHDALSDALNTVKIYQVSNSEEAFDKIVKPIREVFAQSEPLCISLESIFKKLDLVL